MAYNYFFPATFAGGLSVGTITLTDNGNNEIILTPANKSIKFLGTGGLQFDSASNGQGPFLAADDTWTITAINLAANTRTEFQVEPSGTPASGYYAVMNVTRVAGANQERTYWASSSTGYILNQTLTGSGVYRPMTFGNASKDVFTLTTDPFFQLNGATSGGINLLVPAVAGSNSATFPAITGTVPVTGALAHTQSSVAAPTGTTNTTGEGVMMGLAGTITPTCSGTVRFTVQGSVANSTVADGANIHLRTGTGGAPSNAGALAGTTRGSLMQYTAAVGGVKTPFSISYTVTGLTLNTAYWIDVSLVATTAGTATITNVDIIADEIP